MGFQLLSIVSNCRSELIGELHDLRKQYKTNLVQSCEFGVTEVRDNSREPDRINNSPAFMPTSINIHIV